MPAGSGTSCTKPHAGFTVSSDKKTYTYTDASTVDDPVNCPITTWLWTFTDLGTQSNAQNPTPQTYQTGQSHSVTLKVTNAAGTSTYTHTD